MNDVHTELHIASTAIAKAIRIVTTKRDAEALTQIRASIERFVPTPAPKDGYSLLRRWLEKEGMSQRDLAGALGLSESTIYHWGQGRLRPSLDVAAAIERLSNGAVLAVAWADQKAADSAVERASKIDRGSAD